MPPSVIVTSPTQWRYVYGADEYPLVTAFATDSDGSIAKVEFFQGSTKLGEATSNPYNVTWSIVAAGNYTLTAKATDNLGVTATSTPVAVVVKTAGNLPSLSIGDQAVTEGNSGTVPAVFSVILSAPSSLPVTVDYSTASDTAVAGSDFVAASGTLIFAPGETNKTISVAVKGDTIAEEIESFFVNLSNATNASISDGQGLGFIADDDSLPTISITDAAATEGDSATTTTSAIFNVSLSAVSGQIIKVDFATADDTAKAGFDYQPVNGTLIFDPGETKKTIVVAVIGDLIGEPTESFFVNLPNAVNAVLADSQAKGTITDNDSFPKLSISDATVTEGNSGIASAVFTVNLSSASLQPITVDYATTNGTAVAGSDYTAVTGTLSFSSGQTSHTITVPILGDTLDEFDETFLVNLSQAVNATISVGQGIGTILDDDQPPSLLITDAVVSEGNSGTTTNLIFQVRLSTASGKTVSVDYATANGTATAGSDYQSANGKLTFLPGTIRQTVTVTVNGDDLVEPDETVLVNLSNVSNATIGRGQGVGQILNDEELPSLTVTDASVTEGNSGTTNAVFTVLLSIASSQTVTVNFATADGTALAGSDYIALSRAISFPPGTTTTNVSVQVIGDTAQEPDEIFNVRLTNAVNATIARGQGQGAIRNDDNANSPPTVTLTSPANGATFNDPANVTITAVANDTDGSIAKVEFFQGNIKLGETSAIPYSFAWNNVATGNYAVTARATDNLGATATSGPVDVVVKQAGNLPPVVKITSPENRATFPPGSSITITATATDSDGTIGRVEFYAGSTLLSALTTTPYTFTWDNVQVGDYSLTAKAVDNRGATGTSEPVNVAVSQASGDVAIVQNFSDPEITKLQDYLFEMGLSSHVFDQQGLTFQTLQQFKLIIWDDLGDRAQGLTDNEVGLFGRAYTNGIPLYFVGESLAASTANLSTAARSSWANLIHLTAANSKGGDGSVTLLSSSDQNPILKGRFGNVTDFSYLPNVDLASLTDDQAEVLGQSGGADVLVAFPGLEQVDVGQVRTFTQNVRVFNGADEASLQERKILFQNVVCWLIRCNVCGSIDLTLETSASAESVPAGSELTYTLVIQQSGECEGTGVVVTNQLGAGVQFVGVETTQGTWQYADGMVTFNYGRLTSASVTEMKIIVIPTRAGSVTNLAGVRANGVEVRLDNNNSVVVTEVTGSTQPELSITRTLGGQPEIQLQGKAGTSYVVEASTNLVNWITFTNVIATDAVSRFPESGGSKFKARYYRARQGP